MHSTNAFLFSLLVQLGNSYNRDVSPASLLSRSLSIPIIVVFCSLGIMTYEAKILELL